MVSGEAKRVVVVRCSKLLRSDQRKSIQEQITAAVGGDAICLVGDPEIDIRLTGYHLDFKEFLGQYAREFSIGFNTLDEVGQAIEILKQLRSAVIESPPEPTSA